MHVLHIWCIIGNFWLIQVFSLLKNLWALYIITVSVSCLQVFNGLFLTPSNHLHRIFYDIIFWFFSVSVLCFYHGALPNNSFTYLFYPNDSSHPINILICQINVPIVWPPYYISLFLLLFWDYTSSAHVIPASLEDYIYTYIYLGNFWLIQVFSLLKNLYIYI